MNFAQEMCSPGLAAPPVSSQESLRVLQTVYGLYRAQETGRTQSIG